MRSLIVFSSANSTASYLRDMMTLVPLPRVFPLGSLVNAKAWAA